MDRSMIGGFVNAPGASAATPFREPAISREMSRLERTLDELEQSVESYLARTECLRRPVSPATATDNRLEREPEGVCVMSDQLSSLYRRIRNLRSSIAEALELLEL